MHGLLLAAVTDDGNKIGNDVEVMVFSMTFCRKTHNEQLNWVTHPLHGKGHPVRSAHFHVLEKPEVQKRKQRSHTHVAVCQVRHFVVAGRDLRLTNTAW